MSGAVGQLKLALWSGVEHRYESIRRGGLVSTQVRQSKCPGLNQWSGQIAYLNGVKNRHST